MSKIPDRIHGVVKAYAIKGTLLPARALEELAEAKDLDDLVTRLQGTVYAEAVSKVQRPYRADRLELAFREHLAYLHRSLMRVVPKPFLLSAYYLKYVVWNLKTILKGKALGKDQKEVSQYVDLYIEELIGRRDLVVRVLVARDLKEAVEMLGKSEFGHEAEMALGLYQEKKDVQIFDAYLDKAFYRGVLEAFKRTGRDERGKSRSIVAVDVDAYNVLSALRAKLWDLTGSQTRALLIEPTFDIPKFTLDAIIDGESVADGVTQLLWTRYRYIVPTAPSDRELIALLEKAFESLGYRVGKRPFLWHVISDSTALGAIKLKELEVRNLSSIAFGVEQGVGAQNIMAKIVG